MEGQSLRLRQRPFYLKWTACLPAPLKAIRPASGESKRNRRSSRVTLTRAFAALQVFFMVALRPLWFNTWASFGCKPYSFVELRAKLCYPFASFSTWFFQQRVFQKEGFANEQSYHQEREETWVTLHLASFIRDIIKPQTCFGGQVHASKTGHQTFTCRESAGAQSCQGGGNQAKAEAASSRSQKSCSKNCGQAAEADQS